MLFTRRVFSNKLPAPQFPVLLMLMLVQHSCRFSRRGTANTLTNFQQQNKDAIFFLQ
jgi:hypothetical protein